MNKNDLIASVASSAGLSKSDATRSIESFLDAVTNALKRDEKVSSFRSKRAVRKPHNLNHEVFFQPVGKKVIPQS